MKIPSETTIKGKTWKVAYKWGLKGDDGKMVDGLCDPNTRTIYIRREIAKEEKAHVFMHELVHAILTEAHLNYHDDWVPDFIEDIMCEAIASHMIEAFTLKPKLGG